MPREGCSVSISANWLSDLSNLGRPYQSHYLKDYLLKFLAFPGGSRIHSLSLYKLCEYTLHWWEAQWTTPVHAHVGKSATWLSSTWICLGWWQKGSQKARSPGEGTIHMCAHPVQSWVHPTPPPAGQPCFLWSHVYNMQNGCSGKIHGNSTYWACSFYLEKIFFFPFFSVLTFLRDRLL